MGLKLSNIVPWGRNLNEYRKFFQLENHDMKRSILSCADGPASFNTELYELGGQCISIDPIYGFSKEQIKLRIEETSGTIYKQLQMNQGDYIWRNYQSPEDLLEIRLLAMELFLEDYETGKRNGRYCEGNLPDLNLPEQNFDLILCSHFLFTYSNQLSTDFHIESIKQMLKLGKELRIFPLCNLDGTSSIHLSEVEEFLKQERISFELIKVDYEFQKGGNTMLKIFKN